MTAFTIGETLGAAFRVMARDAAPIMAVIFGLTAAISSLSALLIAVGFHAAGFPEEVGDYLLALIEMLAPAVALPFIASITEHRLNGRAWRWRDLRRRALSVIGPTLLIYVAVALIVALGLVILIIPGVIAMCRYFVADIARVIDASGLRDALGRSDALTAGRRWSILGLIIVTTVIIAVVYAAVYGLVAGIGGPENVYVVDNPTLALITGPFDAATTALSIFSMAISAVVSAFSFVVATTAFVRLKAEKEGADANTVAAVFS